MNKTDEELKLAEKMAKRHGVRMCDENGDTHGEELYCVGIDDIADIIREARAEQDHIADTGKIVAEPLHVLSGGGAFPFVEVGYVGEFVAPTKSLPAGTPLCVEPVQPVKQEPVAWAYIDADGSFMDALDRQHGAYQTPLYAAPVSAKREWVELTDDEIFDAYTSDAHENTPKSFARAVIAAFKDKNK